MRRGCLTAGGWLNRVGWLSLNLRPLGCASLNFALTREASLRRNWVPVYMSRTKLSL